MNDEPVCCYTASAARIDVCFHIERNMELVSRSACCKANNKRNIICILCHSN